MGSNTATTSSSVAPATVSRRQRMDTPRPTNRRTSGSGHAAGTTDPNGSSERSMFEILMSIADDTKHLLQKEVELAKQEIVHTLVAKATAVAALAAALVNVLPRWGSRLVVTGGFALLAIVAVLFGLAKLRKPGLVPEETKRTLKEGEEWAIAQLQR